MMLKIVYRLVSIGGRNNYGYNAIMNTETIILIGMSGVGKSTLGRYLAKKQNYTFIDIDKIIEKDIQRSIQSYIDEHGEDQFLNLEEKAILELPITPKTVISPGGSIVYSSKGMTRFKNETFIIYLHDSCDRIKKRIPDLETRGIIGSKTKTFEEIYDERTSLYETYADMIINCEQFQSYDEMVDFISHHVSLLCLNAQ